MWLSPVSSKLWHIKQIKLKSVTYFLTAPNGNGSLMFLKYLTFTSHEFRLSAVVAWPETELLYNGAVTFGSKLSNLVACFLAHLSRRLIGELIVYPCTYSIPRLRLPPLSLLSSSSLFTIFKHLLLCNRLANQSQILCGASLGRGNKSLYKWSRSHDQDGRHAQNLKKSSSPEPLGPLP